MKRTFTLLWLLLGLFTPWGAAQAQAPINLCGLQSSSFITTGNVTYNAATNRFEVVLRTTNPQFVTVDPGASLELRITRFGFINQGTIRTFAAGETFTTPRTFVVDPAQFNLQPFSSYDVEIRSTGCANFIFNIIGQLRLPTPICDAGANTIVANASTRYNATTNAFQMEVQNFNSPSVTVGPGKTLRFEIRDRAGQTVLRELNTEIPGNAGFIQFPYAVNEVINPPLPTGVYRATAILQCDGNVFVRHLDTFRVGNPTLPTPASNLCDLNPQQFNTAANSRYNPFTRTFTMDYRPLSGTQLHLGAGQDVGFSILDQAGNTVVYNLRTSIPDAAGNINFPFTISEVINPPLAPGIYGTSFSYNCNGLGRFERFDTFRVVALPCSLNVGFNSSTHTVNATNDTIRVPNTGQVVIGGTVTGQTGPVSFQWTWNKGLLDVFSNSTSASSGQQLIFNNIPTGTYRATFTANQAGCQNNTKTIVIVSSPPPPPPTQCDISPATFAPATVQFNNLSRELTFAVDYAPGQPTHRVVPGIAYFYIYDVDSQGIAADLALINGGSNVSLNLPLSLTFSGNQLTLGDYEVRFQGACNTGGTTVDFALGTFTVGPQPTGICQTLGTVTANEDTIGLNGSVTFTEQSVATPVLPFLNTKRWNFGPGASPATATGNGPHTVTYATSGRKRVIVSVDNVGGCTADAETLFVEVINCTQLVNTVLAPTQPVNAGDDFTVENTSFNATSGAIYSWDFNGANVVSGSGKGPYTLNFSNPGTYTISVSYTAYGCTSATTSRTVVVNPPCAQVSGVTVGTTTATTAQISWTQGGANAGFNITYRPVGANVWQTFQTAANVTSRILSGLQANTDYEVVVRRICQVGVQSTLSPLNGVVPATFSTNNDPDPCLAPANFQQTAATANSATVTWNTTPGATNYVVHIRRSGTTAWTPFNKASSATSHTFTGLLPNTSYDYFIYAGCSGQRSANAFASGSTANLKTDLGSGLTLYPNPTKGGIVNLRAEGLTSPELNVEILDLTGRVVYANTFRNDLGNSIETQLALPLTSGTYLLRTSGGLSATQRLVVVE